MCIIDHDHSHDIDLFAYRVYTAHFFYPLTPPVPEPAEGTGEGWHLFGLQTRLPPKKSWYRPSPFKEKEIKDEVFIESSMLCQPDKRIDLILNSTMLPLWNNPFRIVQDNSPTFKYRIAKRKDSYKPVYKVCIIRSVTTTQAILRAGLDNGFSDQGGWEPGTV
jgi:hypothetical protein